MRRREFITLLSGAAMASSFPARAQRPKKTPLVGQLWHAGSAEEEGNFLIAVQKGFKDLGYIEGQNIAFEYRFAAEQYERFNDFAAELVRLKVDVLIAVTRPAAIAAKRATTTIPIVFTAVPDPVASKLVDSLARLECQAIGTIQRDSCRHVACCAPTQPQRSVGREANS